MDIFWEILFGTKGKPRNISSDQKIFQTHWRWKIFWLSFSPEEIFLGRLVSVHVSISIIWLEIETQRRDGWATVTWNCWKYFGNHNSCSDYLSNNSIHSISPRKNSIFSWFKLEIEWIKLQWLGVHIRRHRRPKGNEIQQKKIIFANLFLFL